MISNKLGRFMRRSSRVCFGGVGDAIFSGSGDMMKYERYTEKQWCFSCDTKGAMGQSQLITMYIKIVRLKVDTS